MQKRENVRQHTLPKFYITGFCADKKQTDNPNVWHYPLEGPPPREWRLTLAQDLSTREEYFTLPGLSRPQALALDQFFSSLENDAAPVLRRLARGKDPKGVDALTMFMASLLARSPKVIEDYGRFLALISGAPATSYPARAANRPHPAKVARAMLRDAITVFYPALRRMTWNAYQAPGEDRFITSDSPVVMSFSGTPDVREALDHPSLEVFFALDRRSGLVLTQPTGKAEIRVGGAVPGAVADFNARIVMAAKKGATFLLASTRTAPGVAEALAHSRSPGL